ncbi:MAG: hypothetical protein JXO22_15270 [Phycisphaerae bacterium]|nr:hypothetical protein [Phycisphaerae bacterium]
MGRLIHRKMKVQQLAPPANYTTTTDGAAVAVDTKDFEEMIIVADLGVFTAGVTLSLDIQHSDNPVSGFETVPAPAVADINPRKVSLANSLANSSQVAYLDLSALKRYVKAVDTISANSALYGLTAVLFGPAVGPTDQVFQADAT